MVGQIPMLALGDVCSWQVVVEWNNFLKVRAASK
jgi:hypothetical protein